MLPTVEEEGDDDNLSKLDIHVHPVLLRELANVIAGLLDIIFKRLW